MDHDIGKEKREEVLRLMGGLNIGPDKREMKKLENYRFSDSTEIVLGKDSIEVKTDFSDGQKQFMDIKLDGSSIEVHG